MEWKSSLTNVQGRAGSLPEMLFQNAGLKFSLLRGKGKRGFWNTESLWGLSLAQTPHYRALEAEWQESPGGQRDHGEELHESRSVGKQEKNIFHLWY